MFSAKTLPWPTWQSLHLFLMDIRAFRAGLNLMKRILFGDLIFLLKQIIFSFLFVYFAWWNLGRLFVVVLSIWRSAAVNLSVNCLITGCGGNGLDTPPCGNKTEKYSVPCLRQSADGTVCGNLQQMVCNSKFSSIFCGYRWGIWWDHQFEFTAEEFQQFLVHQNSFLFFFF